MREQITNPDRTRKPEYQDSDIKFVKEQMKLGKLWAKVVWIVDIEEEGTTQADAAGQLDMAIHEVGKWVKLGRQTVLQRNQQSS